MKKRMLVMAFALSASVAFGACGGGTAEEPTTEAAESTETTEEATTEAEPETNETMGQKNAVRKAKDYLAFMGFSHSGLIEQLEFEGFTAEQAEYGATAVGY